MTHRPGFVDELALDEQQDASTPAILSPAAVAEVSMPTLDPVLLDIEGATGQRIDPVWEPAIVRPRRRRSGPLGYVATGLAVLLATWVILSAVGFVTDQFQRSATLGLAAVFGTVAGAAIIGAGSMIEWRAYRRLKRVERLRTIFARPEVSLEFLKASALEWVAVVRPSVPEPDAVLARIKLAGDPLQVRQILRRDVVRPLREAARRVGKRAAIEAGAMVAISPSPALDGLLAASRGIALVRRVAEIHGLRPGPLVTLALLRQVSWTAAGVAGFAQLSQSLADHTLHQLPLVKHLASALPETGLAAIRLYRLANITAEACLPLGAET